MRLKGFSGIRAGMSVDEISIDFSELPEGIIVFKAPNGSGKTTIVDNMHPYRIMPSKVKKYSADSFSYYDECFGTAYKELIWSFEGRQYRTLMFIDAEKRKQEAYLYVETEDGDWEPLNRDGKTGSYDKAVEGILGSPDMFFTSIFRAQGARMLSEYVKGDIKDLFSEVFGNEWIKQLAEKAGAVKNELTLMLKSLYNNRQELTQTIAMKEKKQTDYEALKNEIAKQEQLASGLESAKNEAENTVTDIRVQIGLQESTRKRRNNLASDIAKKEEAISSKRKDTAARTSSYSAKMSALTGRMSEIRKLIDEADSLRTRIAQLPDMENKSKALRSSIAQYEKERGEVRATLDVLRNNEDLLRKKEKALDAYRMTIKHKKDLLEKEIDRMKRDAAKLDTYPCKDNSILSESCPFLKDAFLAKNVISHNEAELDILNCNTKEKETQLLGEIESLSPVLNRIKELQTREKQLMNELDPQNKELRNCEKSIEEMRAIEKKLSGLLVAETSIPEIEAHIKELVTENKTSAHNAEKEIRILEGEISLLKNEIANLVIDHTLAQKEEETVKLLDELTLEIKNHRSRNNENRKTLGSLNEGLRIIEEAESKLLRTEQEIAYLNQEISEYTILEKAHGNDGIIALEITDAGPAVSSIANELLKVYDNRYSVKIDTQSMKKDGKTLKEDFDIIVFDSLANESKSIKKMSGGQVTWINDAVARALCLYIGSAKGNKFDVIFTDETDGALDPDKKKAFFETKTLVHKLGGYSQEYCITHTPELFRMASAVIELKDGGISVTNN